MALGVATAAWFRISLQTFGGPAGQIAVMHRELVEERRWFAEDRFLHALNYCMLLPGPEAQQLATYLGWLLNGTLGGLIAGALFVLPGFVAILVLSLVYARFGDTAAVEALLAGAAPAVLGIVASAVVRVGKRALSNRLLTVIAVLAFVALSLFAVPFPVVVLAAAAVGAVGSRLRPEVFQPSTHGVDADDDGASDVEALVLHRVAPSWGRAARVVGLGAVVWGVPVVACVALFGRGSIFVTQAMFFSGAAVVTFGGAYAVLAYIAQRAVNTYHWLLPGEMLKGLAMAETTPGPLIQVVQFVGCVGAFRNPGDLDPWVAGIVASVLVTWVTYVPCFVWIFLGAPHIEALRSNARLGGALAGITAAVVGVIANLALYFAVHTLFDRAREFRWAAVRVTLPDPTTIDVPAAAVAALAMVLIFRMRWSVLRTLGACLVAGAVLYAATAG